MIMYTARDWYWVIGDDEANVWSSRLAESIPVDDADYAAWLEGGNYPSRAATMADLEVVLAEQYPPGTLRTYTAFKRWQKEQAGITLTSGMPIKTDDRAQAKITGAYTAAQVDPTIVTPWAAADGTVHDVDGAQITSMNYELLTHINNCFSISADVMADIEDGSVTTREQIDEAFSAPVSAARRDWLKRA
jgi:Domain of unknown function (DUF4376)